MSDSKFWMSTSMFEELSPPIMFSSLSLSSSSSSLTICASRGRAACLILASLSISMDLKLPSTHSSCIAIKFPATSSMLPSSTSTFRESIPSSNMASRSSI
uniref:Uncharacterized protein n=1 Tax=Lotus japonicus TaxID=34305 RepID=I3SKT9_LOTJA|nr:unknown [Lotus japonicus]